MNAIVLGLTISALLAAGNTPAFAAPVRWDYEQNPVTVTENKPARSKVLHISASAAFDGYGAQGSRPAAARVWQQSPPAENAPTSCDIDYGKPVAVSAFVHYFYVPDNRDLRLACPGSSAFKRVRISAKDDGSNWAEVVTLDNLPRECPQVLPVKATQPARYWRIEIQEMAPGAELVMSYEIETYTGGVPTITPTVIEQPDFMADFARRMKTHKPAAVPMKCQASLKDDAHGFSLSFAGNGRVASGELQLVLDGQPAALASSGKGAWRAACADGEVILRATDTALGLLLDLTYRAKSDRPVKYKRAALQMTAPKVDLYYVPAYVWSREPVDVMPAAWCVQTRMTSLGVKGATLCLVPGTDCGTLGIHAGAARSDLLLGPAPTPVLLTGFRAIGGRPIVLPWTRCTVSRAAADGAGERNAVWHLPLSAVGRHLGADPGHDEVVARSAIRNQVSGYFDAFNLYGVDRIRSRPTGPAM